MGRMTYVKALMCLLFPSAALVARAQHPVAGDLKCKLTGRMLMDGGVYLKNDTCLVTVRSLMTCGWG